MSILSSKTVTYSRYIVAVIICVTSLCIVLYQIYNRNEINKEIEVYKLGAQHTALTARDFLRKYQSNKVKSSEKCSHDCLTALWLVAETKDILTQYEDDLDKGIDVLLKYRDRLRNPVTQEYPFVIERTFIQGKPYYITKVHGNKRIVNLPIHDVQKIMDTELCPSETCKVKPLIDKYYSSTDLQKKRYTTLRYAWYDSITGNEIYKESIICRFNKDIVIGSGYTVKLHKEIPSLQLVAICVSLYALLLLYMFSFPGTFFIQSYKSFKSKLYLHYGFIIVYLACVFYLILRHTNTLSIESSLNETVIYNQTQTKRIVAGTLAAMALSFTFIQRDYPMPVVKEALYTTVVFSIIAFIDVLSDVDLKTEDEERSLIINYHFTSTFVTCGIFVLVWLFTFIILQTE